MFPTLALVATITIAAPVPKIKPPPMLQVQAFESRIVLGDPVDLQVDFVNTKSETVVTKDEITHLSLQSLWIEVKPVDEVAFRKIRLSEYQISDTRSKVYRVKYPPGASCVQHIFVHRNEKGKLNLPTAGKWNIRAIIDSSDGLIVSEAIEIAIADATEGRLQSIEKHQQQVMTTAMFRGHAPTKDLSVLKDTRADLGESYLGEVIENSLFVRAFLDATTADAKTAAREAVGRRLDKLPRGPRDLMAIDYALALAERQEIDAATKVLASVRTKFDHMQYVEDIIRKEAAKPKR